MKRFDFLILLFAIVTLHACQAQTKSKNEFYNQDFNWTIVIPENFEGVKAEDWDKMQNKGANAVEKTYGEKIVNQSKTIFVFKSDQLNYFESNYQPFDPAVDGNYDQSFKTVNEVLYETFKAQIPGAKMDTVSVREVVSGLEFHVFKLKMGLPNKIELNLMMFSRLFEKREFTVNIMYADKSKGDVMLNAWRNSKFKK